MKFKKEKIKQICLTIIAFSLIMLGYFNYSLDNSKETNIEVSAESTNDVNLGDVQLVNSKPDTENKGSIVSNDNLENNVNEQNVEESNLSESKEDVDNYFEETKLQRDRMYSEMLETYQKLVDSQETPADQKAIAVQEITNITNTKNGIMIAENLIKNKGFENVIILINNNITSVVVKSTTLNKEQISQIQNIVERQLNVQPSNINITNK